MMHIILQICSQDVLISQILNLAETRSALFCFVLVSERLHSRKEQDIADSGRAVMKKLQTELDQRIFADPYRDMYII